MSGPIPISLASLAGKESMAAQNQAIGQQVAAEDDMMASAQDSFNAMAAARAQSRYDRFRSLDTRRYDKARESHEGDTKKVEGTEKKGEEDLAKNFSQKNPELPAAKLRQLRQSVNQDLSEEEIYNRVNSAFEDPTLADEALEYLEQATTGPLKEKISRVRQFLNEEKKREIIGGRNIDSVAKDFASRGYGQSPTALRDLYRNITQDAEKDHNALFETLSKQYPFDQLKEVVAFLLKGLSYDLKSKGPSISQPELMRLMKETRNLQSVLWVFLFFKERMKLMRNLYARYGMSYPDELDFETLAKSFMKLVADRYPSMLKILKEAERIGLLEDLEKVIVLTQYRDAIRGLSPRLYHSARHKQDLLLAMLETLEELEKEEEEEEEQEKV